MTQLSPSQHNSAQQWMVQAAQGGTLPHSLLLWGAGDLLSLATMAASAYQCQGQTPPCGLCLPCQKVAKAIHPDVMVVEDNAHKMIAVDVVRDLRQSAFVLPNEGKRKVFIFPDAALLTPQDQNVLLKLVEEGPSYCAFVFCVENLDMVLPTLRSRCVTLFAGQSQDVEKEPSALGVALCQSLLGKKGALTAWAVTSEGQKPTRQALEEALADGRRLCMEALLAKQTARPAPSAIAHNLAQGLSAQRLSKTISLLQHYHSQCAFNIGVGHTLGALAIELEELS